MEDQQPATGDLTDEISDSQDDAAAETEVAESGSESSESEPGVDSAVGDENADVTIEDEETEAEASDEAVGGFRVRRPVGKWSAIAAAVAAALFVGAGAFAGATVQPYLKDRAIVATKLRVARTAANAITTLWTYTPDNIEKLADRAAQYLSGDFEAEYRKYIDAIAAPNKQAKVTNSTQVTGAAVESLNGPDATAIVYTNTTSTSPATKDVPSLRYLSYRLTLQRDHARWLVTRMNTVTSLDLTPKF
ncbi:MAG: Mce-associated rane protein [Mycobacterium sp.]|nr:Mce-associated rane protein [Mycobacterium sp.]MDT5253461.1 Mce-associated rane protein [Mycobacterium sp.]MDT5306057.1 Mce-associated rane protein [Mycobacterium sp.]MDT7737780.1 Mce-associated rane protein [Mycobacterium sp.]